MFKNINNKILRQALEWITSILFAVILFLFIYNFIARTAVVSGPSMNPTLNDNDRLVVSRLTYIIKSPSKNDIIIFPFSDGRLFVKRIIGMPGDVITVEDSNFYINGELLNDSFSLDKLKDVGDNKYPITVPLDSYFVLGDNRNESSDSRFTEVGFVPRKIIIGKVSFRFFPLNNINLIH